VYLLLSLSLSLSIGVSSLLFNYEKKKSIDSFTQTKFDERPEEIRNRHFNTENKIKTEEIIPPQSQLLPDATDIVGLKIDNNFIDQMYNEARSEAIGIFNDVQLSSFSIQVFPFQHPPMVNIYFDFYSKWADKICSFQYIGSESPYLRLIKPYKTPIIDNHREVFSNLPWKNTALLLLALRKSYDKIKPLTSTEETCYNLFAYAQPTVYWRFIFEDGFNGNRYRFSWDTKGLAEKNIQLLD